MNKARAAYFETQPSKTDQSQANDTDINVIMKRYTVTGVAPGAATGPQYQDFTELPQDLRGLIEQTRSIKHLRGTLPDALRDKPMEELLTLTPAQLMALHTPVEPNKPTEEQK